MEKMKAFFVAKITKMIKSMLKKEKNTCNIFHRWYNIGKNSCYHAQKGKEKVGKT